MMDRVKMTPTIQSHIVIASAKEVRRYKSENKPAIREQIQKDIRAFQRNGGKIKQIPKGLSGFEEAIKIRQKGLARNRVAAINAMHQDIEFKKGTKK